MKVIEAILKRLDALEEAEVRCQRLEVGGPEGRRDSFTFPDNVSTYK